MTDRMGDCAVSYEAGWLTRLKLEFAWFSGFARLTERSRGGAGVILKFERVRPARSGGFQPLKSLEITPQFLDRMIGQLKRWNLDIVSIDEACRRASHPRAGRRFVCLTFDGGYKDVVEHAHSILSRHEVPFTVYLPTAFPDGLGEAWWLALEAVIATHHRISLMIDERERHFAIGDFAEKVQAHHYLDSWMRTLPPPALSAAVNDLCTRYSVDLAAVLREAAMDWDDITRLAADPLVTIGTSTVNYPILANLKDAAALREITMGRAVAQAALGRDPLHLAYPFGDRGSFNLRHVAMAADAGFASAVTAVPGVVQPDGRSDLHALPRIAWDGRRRSLRALQVMLSGVMLDA
ncbi:MAG: polysaccharide deacetylase [Tardiphaga sp.]|nr:polysaccharide deacetylase [Tardiphaga sp.]